VQGRGRGIRIGVIGHWAIGARVVEHVVASLGLELAFLLARSPVADAPIAAISEVSDDDLAAVDLVVEAAHPDVVSALGDRIVAHADLMVVSVGGLVDDDRRAALRETARRSGTRIVLPFGALTGLESLASRPESWRSATITFVKPPHAFEPPSAAAGRTVLYDGPVRGVASEYPRNVNAMVTFALATAGLDLTRAVLVSDPDQPFASLEYEALAADGGQLHVRKSQPLIGVSGTEMPDAIVHSLETYAGGRPGIWFG
jgi:aspartate dehydrogenase